MAPAPLSLEDQAPEARLQRALASGIVPRLYANGMVTSTTTGDVLVLLESNGAPAAILNLSFTIAKTLALGLGQAITQLEEATGREMLTASEVESKMQETTQKSAASK